MTQVTYTDSIYDNIKQTVYQLKTHLFDCKKNDIQMMLFAAVNRREKYTERKCQIQTSHYRNFVLF
ncbi:hypothetical protein NFHSH190041_14290 [Shewanella sp. NFH-SH190041]|nr:hypothetical protein NFHSH190041_14290 [Shewanella sp. NFH-SH190041]